MSKVDIMPVTVPNKPSKGETDAITRIEVPNLFNTDDSCNIASEIISSIWSRSFTNIMLTGSDDKTASNEAHFSTAQTA
jgi:hypothetical protein